MARIGRVTVAMVAWIAGQTVTAAGQTIEIAPFGGYRFGGDLFERAIEGPVDSDGAAAVGCTVNVALTEGLQFEAVVARQDLQVAIPTAIIGVVSRRHVTVDHVQAGGLQEFAAGRVRPFATGVLGLTRYAADGDSEIRFTVGAGGGVKLFPVSRVGFRLDGRVYTTFVDADATFLACSAGVCVTALRVDVVWQAEFTAGLVVRLH